MFRLQHKVDISWLANKLNLEFNVDGSEFIEGVTSLDNLVKNYLSFSSKNTIETKGVIIGVKESDFDNVIYSDNPRLDFIKALNILDSEVGFKKENTSAIFPDSVVLGENVVIESDVVIGKNTVIGHNVVIHSGTRIGENTIIGSNTTIGADGFGYERDLDGNPIKFLHFGKVIIGNSVQIGANNTITRGTLGDTTIENNVKTDNLVHVAHNCIIRQGAFLTAGSIFCGGVDFGKNSWMAPNSTIMQKLIIGEEALIGLGAVVTKNVKAGDVVAGNPAKVLRKHK